MKIRNADTQNEYVCISSICCFTLLQWPIWVEIICWFVTNFFDLSVFGICFVCVCVCLDLIFFYSVVLFLFILFFAS